jgi:hypothetical protein
VIGFYDFHEALQADAGKIASFDYHLSLSAGLIAL